MRVPSYRKHSSGQARVTINGKDHLLGKYGSPESKEAYGRLIAEFNASQQSTSFGKAPATILMEDVLLAYIKFAKKYYGPSTELENLKLAIRPVADLYGSVPASRFGPREFKAVREWWLAPSPAVLNKDGKPQKMRPRSRQYINAQLKRMLRVIKWAVAEGLVQAENYTAIRCVEPLRRGRTTAREAKPVTCVDPAIVTATLPHLTRVLADMVCFQQLVGCRPGELIRIQPGMLDRSQDVWTIKLDDHKTAYRGKDRVIYVGPKAQSILVSYLDRPATSFCFSPIESEQQRREARTAARVTPQSCGNACGTNVSRRPRKTPGECYTTHSYRRAIKYACDRAGLPSWSPNQLRHNAATNIRRHSGIEAASVILGHSEVGVTQIYAEADTKKARKVALEIG